VSSCLPGSICFLPYPNSFNFANTHADGGKPPHYQHLTEDSPILTKKRVGDRLESRPNFDSSFARGFVRTPKED